MHSPRRSAMDGQQAVAEQLGEPAGQVAAHEVAIGAGGGPAGDQAERDGVALEIRRVFVIQQAEVVFPALAQHHALALLGRFAGQLPLLGGFAEAASFTFDLALQVAGVGGDPDGALVVLGPEAGGGEVAEGFAGAGAGFRQHQMRRALRRARVEGGGGGGGVVGLRRALLRRGAEQGGQPGAGFGGRHREG